MDKSRKVMTNMDTDSKPLCQETETVVLIVLEKEQEIETYQKEAFNQLLQRHSGKVTK